ncbi:MAG: hypothetical protein VR68_07990 [Peptococcaceae bacterium BRH_c4a]|nr:MAG: hypothetical protein VR68_07990 [Peptococcaceae bacterium BRH_c4a]
MMKRKKAKKTLGGADMAFKVGVSVLIFLVFCLPGGTFALPEGINEVKPPVQQKTRQVVIIVIDGLQADSVSTAASPNISGLGMAGIKVGRVSVMPPDNNEFRLYTMLSGTEQWEYTKGDKAEPAPSTILSQAEKKGIKTAFIDGTGHMEGPGKDVSYKYPGPFKNDGEVVDTAMDVIRKKKPFISVMVMAGPGKRSSSLTDSKSYLNSILAADNEVGRFLKQLHIDGTYEETMLVVTGTTGKPPLIVKGVEFLSGSRLAPACLKDLAPTLGYLFGINIPNAKGLILWNSLKPAPDRSDNFMMQQRVLDLSTAFADAVDSAARLENEKITVQEEKVRLTAEKRTVEEEIAYKDDRIKRLNTIILVMKAAGIGIIVLFVSAMIMEYRILKKKFLFFT